MSKLFLGAAIMGLSIIVTSELMRKNRKMKGLKGYVYNPDSKRLSIFAADGDTLVFYDSCVKANKTWP